tara:strand:- start:1387 stop:1665 length:279 start_codon:yes stop_codon:yes gene_type:complete
VTSQAQAEDLVLITGELIADFDRIDTTHFEEATLSVVSRIVTSGIAIAAIGAGALTDDNETALIDASAVTTAIASAGTGKHDSLSSETCRFL